MLRNIYSDNIKLVNENDVLFLCHDYIQSNLEHVLQKIKLFKKNRYLYFYENINHFHVNYYYNILYPHVDIVFCSGTELKDIWIPGYHSLFDNYNNDFSYSFILDEPAEKKKLICTNPISTGTGYNIRYPILKYFSENFNELDIYCNCKKYNFPTNII